MPKDVVAYADKATNRCQRKYQRMMFKGKNSNQAVATVAKELCCFIWGMMTGHYSRKAQAEASVYRSELDQSFIKEKKQAQYFKVIQVRRFLSRRFELSTNNL